MPDDGSSRGPPLCPAGHLPLKGGDRQLRRRRSTFHLGDWRKPSQRPISPLEGEMSGRTERGASLQPLQSRYPSAQPHLFI
ncbi:MAG: endonuclease domain-containing protein, partial [Mesorhizobium sp.]